jgi:biotin operon repressor
MQEVTALTALYRHYKNGRIGRKVFEAKLMGEVACRAPLMIGKRRGKDLSDFLAWLYPRLCSAADNYKNNGSSFDAYIHIIVNRSYQEFQMKNIEREITERAVWSVKAYEKVSEDECLCLADNAGEPPLPFTRVRNRRQVLILLLKSYYFLSDDFISRIAPALGMNKEKIDALVTELRDLRAEREQEIHDLSERVHAQFYRCLSFQYRAASASPNSARYRQYLDCLERGVKRLSSMRETLRKLGAEASNKEIAEVLGISKGTVDASLFTVRRNYSEFLSGLGASVPPA